MAKVHLYKYLSDSFDTIEIKEGVKLSEAFIDLDFSKRMIFINGEYTENIDYIIQDIDDIIIKSIPGEGMSSMDFSSSDFSSLSSFSNPSGNYGPNIIPQLSTSNATVELESTETPAWTVDEIRKNPTLAGAKNSLATGLTQPYIIGNHHFTPYILNSGNSAGYKGYHTIDGKNGTTQYYNLVLEGGFNKQVINEVKCGDIPVYSSAATEPQEGTWNLECSKDFAGANSIVEFAQDGNAFGNSYFNKKIVEKEHNDVLKQSNEADYKTLIYNLEDNASRADVIYMYNGLIAYSSSGTKKDKTRATNVQYSFDYNEKIASGVENAESAATWVDFPKLGQVTHITPGYTIDKEATYKVSFCGCLWKDRESKKYRYTRDEAIKFVKLHRYGKSELIWDIKDRNEFNSDIWDLKTGEDLRSYIDTADTTMEFNEGYEGHNVAGTKSYYFWIFSVKIKYHRVVPDTYTTYESNEVTGQYTEQIRFCAHKEFLFSDLYKRDENNNWVKKYNYPIAIRLSNSDSKSTADTETCECYVEYVQSTCFDPEKSAESGDIVLEKVIEDREAKLSTLIGLHIEATEKNPEAVGKITINTSGVARTWNESYWTTTKTATSNPAAWFLEVLTSEKHPASQIKSEEESSLIDFESLGEWYEFCEERGYSVNYVITSGMEKAQILSMILSCGRAIAYRNIYGKIAIAIDKEKDNAIGLLNEQNLISFDYKKTITRQCDGVRVKYINGDKGYQEDSFIVMYNQYDKNNQFDPYGKNRDADCVLKEVEVKGCTSWYEAYRYALYLMRCDRIRQKTVTAQVGEEGIFFTPLSKLLIQHPSLKIGLGSAEIRNIIVNAENMICGLDLYDAIEMTEGESYYVVMNCFDDDGNCKTLTAKLVTEEGWTKTISFAEESYIDIDADIIPHKNDILSYGYSLTSVTSPMLITGIEKTTSGYTLTLVDYDESIYSLGDDFKDYHPNITEPNDMKAELPKDVPNASTGDLLGMMNTMTAESVAYLYNSVPVTLYRDSTVPLTDDDLPSQSITYDFSNDTITPATVDSWSREYPKNATGTIYQIVATAFGKDKTDTIAASSWSNPIATGQNGVNGSNTLFLQLFKRQDDKPSTLPGTLTYNFRSGNLTGILNGWKRSIPSIEEASGEVWEIHATIASLEESAAIDSSKWEEPAQITAAAEINKKDVQDLIDASMPKVLETPNIIMDTFAVSFAVNAANYTTVSQSVAVNIKVVQAGNELNYSINDIELPSGVSYTRNGSNIIFTVESGVFLKEGYISIPIVYKQYKYRNALGWIDADGEMHVIAWRGVHGATIDSKSITDYAIGFSSEATSATTTTMKLTYTTVKGGRNLGAKETKADVDSIDLSTLIIGDYFTFTGATTAASSVDGGQLITSCVYTYLGSTNAIKWKYDNDALHIMGALSDILSIDDKNLEENNIDAFRFIKRLAANEIFAGTIYSQKIFTDEFTSIGADVASAATKADNAASAIIKQFDATTIEEVKNRGTTLIKGGYLNTDIIEAKAIKADFIDVDTLLGTDATFKGTLKIGSVDSSGNYPFSVSKEGKMKAEGAVINGAVNITKGLTFSNYIEYSKSSSDTLNSICLKLFTDVFSKLNSGITCAFGTIKNLIEYNAPWQDSSGYWHYYRLYNNIKSNIIKKVVNNDGSITVTIKGSLAGSKITEIMINGDVIESTIESSFNSDSEITLKLSSSGTFVSTKTVKYYPYNTEYSIITGIQDVSAYEFMF